MKVRTKNKRSLLFSLAVPFFFFLLSGLQVWFFDPDSVKDIIFPSSYLSFFIPFALGIFFSMNFLGKRKSFVITSAVVCFLYLRILGLGTVFNTILLGGFFASVELYFYFKIKEKEEIQGK